MKYTISFLIMLTMSFPTYALLVGKVDIQNVLVSVKEGKKVRDQLKGEFEKKRKILDTEQEKIKKLQQNFSKQSLVMNDKAKVEKEKEIQQKIIELQQKSLGFQKEIQEMEGKMKAPILERIKSIVDQVSKKAGVDVTFEMSTAPVIYAKSEKDLTREVIKAYDKKYSK